MEPLPASLGVLRLAHRRLHRASYHGDGPRRRRGGVDAEPPAGRRVGWLRRGCLPAVAEEVQEGPPPVWWSPRRLATRRCGNGSVSRGSAESKPGGVMLTISTRAEIKVAHRTAPYCGESMFAARLPWPLRLLRHTRGRRCFSQERRSCTILAATLKTPLDMSTRATRPIQIYAFGRSISPALCGMFPGLEYVFTIDMAILPAESLMFD